MKSVIFTALVLSSAIASGSESTFKGSLLMNMNQYFLGGNQVDGQGRLMGSRRSYDVQINLTRLNGLDGRQAKALGECLSDRQKQVVFSVEESALMVPTRDLRFQFLGCE